MMKQCEVCRKEFKGSDYKLYFESKEKHIVACSSCLLDVLDSQIKSQLDKYIKLLQRRNDFIRKICDLDENA